MPERRVRVKTHGRLHMGFLDLHGGLGRQFGSIGVSVDGLITDVEVALATEAGIDVSGPDADRAGRYLEKLATRFGIPLSHRVCVHDAVTSHAGLGSGTQLALAVGAAFSRLHDLDLDAVTIAAELGRGKRSAIGVGAFTTGGFVVDGGKGESDRPPPVLFSMAFPEHWRLILLFDHRYQGLHGNDEKQAFRKLAPLPEARAAELCRLALMQMLPAVKEADCQRFGAAITHIQRVVGDHFSPLQGGRFASPAVAGLLGEFARFGAAGYGQSSWGPTGFVIAQSQPEAEQLVAQVQQRWPDHGCEIGIYRAMNQPATVHALDR